MAKKRKIQVKKEDIQSKGSLIDKIEEISLNQTK